MSSERCIECYSTTALAHVLGLPWHAALYHHFQSVLATETHLSDCAVARRAVRDATIPYVGCLMPPPPEPWPQQAMRSAQPSSCAHPCPICVTERKEMALQFERQLALATARRTAQREAFRVREQAWIATMCHQPRSRRR